MSREIDLSQCRRVLVTKLRHHGDVLLSSPVFQVLKQQYPHLEIDALVYEDTSPMLAGHPAISQLHCIDRQWKKLGAGKHLAEERGLLKQLKARDYDLLIHLTESWRGAWLSRLLKPAYSVVRKYPGRSNRLWKNSFTHHYASPAGNRRHTVDMHLDALRHIGVQPQSENKKLLLAVAEADVKKVADQWPAAAGKTVLLHPTSRWMFKTWPADKVAAVIRYLQQQGMNIVVTAAPAEKELNMVEEILQSVEQPVVNLAGKLSLKQLAAAIDRADLFVGVDSVPMHIAAAMQTPAVALFGPSGDNEWGPWMSPNQVIASDISCRPCGQDGCGGSKVSDCLTMIEVERVCAAAMEWLTE
ncbi:putative lipopolysaccharide heptosyltransferase III [Neptuniibacter halophilus]|uniref:putative lipopolysaccharide heptosyltransferase III n=1 Tax=Neptuniibacter halophilus TaxID=651666 RepID=UPI0025735B93|nr:putative lipopolysaccharide heptosyltransferase III [Neptuniibacter halophilus]